MQRQRIASAIVQRSQMALPLIGVFDPAVFDPVVFDPAIFDTEYQVIVPVALMMVRRVRVPEEL